MHTMHAVTSNQYTCVQYNRVGLFTAELFSAELNTGTQTHCISAHMTALSWHTRDLASDPCIGRVRHSSMQRHAASRLSKVCSESSSASSSRSIRMQNPPSVAHQCIGPASVRIASELSMEVSTTGSHEDHAEHCAGQDAHHADHVDGRLRRSTGRGTRKVAQSQTPEPRPSPRATTTSRS